MRNLDARRTLLLANLFNLVVGVYLIIISLVALIKLRWYHQLSVTIRIRHLVTTATSYFSFLLLILVALLQISQFVIESLSCGPRSYIASQGQDAILPLQQRQSSTIQGSREASQNWGRHSSRRHDRPMIGQQVASRMGSCSIGLHLASSVLLVLVLVVWLLNTGELVRDSISSQLDMAYEKYQFANRSNRHSVAIDAMQDVNECCGRLDYTDFPHHRGAGLSPGHYPGSCCGKSVFGINARVLCSPEEIQRRQQVNGCVTVLASFYDLISLLVCPAALVSLFVNIGILSSLASKHSSDTQILTQISSATNATTNTAASPTPAIDKASASDLG